MHLTPSKLGGLLAHHERLPGITLTAIKGCGIALSASLCCPVGFGGWEYLMVNEGYVLTTDGQRILVRKRRET